MGIKWISSVGEKQTHFDLLLLFALHYCQRGIKKYITPDNDKSFEKEMYEKYITLMYEIQNIF